MKLVYIKGLKGAEAQKWADDAPINGEIKKG